MKRLFSAAGAVDAWLLRDRLEHAGIDAHVFNEHMQSIVGDVPPDVAGPQVWVDDENYARAPARCWKRFVPSASAQAASPARAAARRIPRRSTCAGSAGALLSASA